MNFLAQTTGASLLIVMTLGFAGMIRATITKEPGHVRSDKRVR